jgi:hypothetical protein
VILQKAMQEDVVREASRAPSVHNIQPARWRFEDGRVTLFRALDRALPVADATGHDLRASLGASFEGMAIALSVRGLLLGAPEPIGSRPAPPGLEAVCSASLTKSESPPDVLAPFVAGRRSFRGRFAAAGENDARLLGGAIAAPDVVIAAAPSLGEIASLHDAATWTFESRPEYHAELWTWLRLSRRDPRYSRDGLNGDCLALSPIEQWAARLLLAPRTFATLTALRLARPLVSEAAQVKSASLAVVFTPRADLDAFDVGRRMYRLWLEITRAGFYLAPMSASADDPVARAELTRRFNVPGDRRIANVFRVGRQKPDAVAISPRLPVEEIRLSS